MPSLSLVSRGQSSVFHIPIVVDSFFSCIIISVQVSISNIQRVGHFMYVYVVYSVCTHIHVSDEYCRLTSKRDCCNNNNVGPSILLLLSIPHFDAAEGPGNNLYSFLFFTCTNTHPAHQFGSQKSPNLPLHLCTSLHTPTILVNLPLSKPAPRKKKSGLAAETLKPRKKLPPLLVAAGQRQPEGLHWVGSSFGVTGQLLRLWKRAGFKLVYLRQTTSDLTGKRVCSESAVDLRLLIMVVVVVVAWR